MSAVLARRGMGDVLPVLRRYGPTLALLGATAVLGMAGSGLARPLFILGCVAVSWDVMRAGPAAHLASSFILFCAAAFLRRLVDVGAGYEPSGLMISGPLLAIALPAPIVMQRLASRRLDPALRPFMLAMACEIYAVLLTAMEGNIMLALSNGLKWLAPLIYGLWLHGESEREADMLAPLTRVAMVVMPVLGLYGFLQYVNPPVWDRFWMINTTIASIGQPAPFEVRVFSTMNAPAGYATFAAACLLLFGFRRLSPALLLAAGPTTLGLLLTMYRTAWLGLAAGILLGLFHPRTRLRALALLIAVPILGGAAIAFTPAGDALTARLETLGAVSSDSSGQERLGQYAMMLEDDRTLIGHGFGAVDVMQAGAVAFDGQIIVSWFVMGLVVGMLCLAAVLWAGVQAMRLAWRDESLSGLAVTGIMAALLAQIPLAVISSSEIGFLFWSFAAIGASRRAD